MKTDLRKAWRAVSTRGGGEKMKIEPPSRFSTKLNSRVNLVKKLFSRGKKVQDVQGLNDASMSAIEAPYQTEQERESASAPITASGNPIERVGQPILDVQNKQGPASGNGFPDELKSPDQFPTQEPEHPVFSQLMCPKIRRVGSQDDLRSIFDASGSTPCQLSHTLPQDEQVTPLVDVSPKDPDTTEPQDEDKKLDEARKSAHDRPWELDFETQKQGHKNELADLKDDHEDEIKAMKAESDEQIQAAEAENLVLQKRIDDFETQKQGHENELADLKDDHEDEIEAMKAESDEQIQAAEAKNLALQKRIEELESSKAAMEVDLESKQGTVQHLVTASQRLQTLNDKLREQNSHLCRESESSRSTLNFQLAATIAADEGRKTVQLELDGALTENRVLAAGLVDAQNHSRFFENRLHELSHAMEQTPNEIANISGVIELKDKMFSDLEQRAGECFTALTTLTEKSDEEKDVACREKAALRAELQRHEQTIADLRESKDNFQQQCEAVFAMLLKKVFRDDLINAMEEYFQVAVQDNVFLKTEVLRQVSALSAQNLKLSTLETAFRESERSLKAEKESSKELKLALGTKDFQLGALQIKINSIRANHQSVIDEKDARIADVSSRLREETHATVQWMVRGRDEGARLFIESKDTQITALEQKCNELSSAHNLLEQYVQAQADVSAENAGAICLIEAKWEETMVKLRAAQEQIETQQDQLRGRPGLPAQLSIAEVLEMKNAVQEAQLKIEELEHQQQVSHDQTPEASVPHSTIDNGLYGESDNDLYGASNREKTGQKEEAKDDNESDCSFF